MVGNDPLWAGAGPLISVPKKIINLGIIAVLTTEYIFNVWSLVVLISFLLAGSSAGGGDRNPGGFMVGTDNYSCVSDHTWRRDNHVIRENFHNNIVFSGRVLLS